MSDIAFKVLIGNGYDDILFKTIMLKGEKGDQGEAGATGIDDSVVASDKTWSSSKIKNEMDSLPKNFSALNDVEINTPQDDQAPLYDATAGKWKNKTVDASTLKYSSTKTIKQQIDDKSVLTGLNDVAISSPQGNQGLVYNATTGKWENGAVSSTSALAQLTDVLLNTPIENLSSLVYDLTSGKWKNKRLKIICTQAQYDAWKNASPSQLIPNTDYLITDALNLNPTASDVEWSTGVSVEQAMRYLFMAEQGDLNVSINTGTSSPRLSFYKSTASNKPSGNSGILFTMGDGTYRQQMAVDLQGGIYVRYYNNGTISDWSNVIKSDSFTVSSASNVELVVNKTHYITNKIVHIFAQVKVTANLSNASLITWAPAIDNHGITIPLFSGDGQWSPASSIIYGYLGSNGVLGSATTANPYVTIDQIVRLA